MRTPEEAVERRQKIQIYTETKGLFKGRSYRVMPNGQLGERVFREGEKVNPRRRMVRTIPA